MTDQPLHPDHELVELALGELGEPQRGQLMRHLTSCPPCRAAYEGILAAVDATLPAAPQIAPPVGFEQRVLTTVGSLATAESAAQQPRRRPRARLLLAAAAAVLAVVAGGIAAISIWGDDDTTPGPMLTADSAPLRKDDGEIVGTAAVSSIDGEPVVVVSISQPAVGIPYHCRVLLKNGRDVDAGRWAVDEPGGSTWITHAPKGHIIGLDLVTDDGRVWSSARMP
ncbi:MAG TPA: zf-HC2 domain-containing protein [Nocardioidaceae bacterium]|nr:zf-HC2 domain-containing protein [Nocardioidaceae bacterium]